MESCSLQLGKTSYKMRNGMQPNLSHLSFSAHCFACIPPKLQMKLGPWSHEAVVVGYALRIKAYCCCGKATSVLFNSSDVIFDENFTGCVFPDSDNDNDSDSSVAHISN
ncbi:hypothetical protein PAXRUDRAFT_139018 [Paxillus rubicundulus Ve08.2h10]|uniref:Retroviral polymerase SH3-like domain-containing protein n=1 Tax=Paxillus rubicundulus Ve08.2h10 TaxID=930991 RepID=A0A0D0DS78_9AGAM|nr:hypothetical protein PAXRUDRAFT_139018 [Paxillus rubicundulus Ve08.2h10]